MGPYVGPIFPIVHIIGLYWALSFLFRGLRIPFCVCVFFFLFFSFGRNVGVLHLTLVDRSCPAPLQLRVRAGQGKETEIKEEGEEAGQGYLLIGANTGPNRGTPQTSTDFDTLRILMSSGYAGNTSIGPIY